jgi:hypothetical protein
VEVEPLLAVLEATAVEETVDLEMELVTHLV